MRKMKRTVLSPEPLNCMPSVVGLSKCPGQLISPLIPVHTEHHFLFIAILTLWCCVGMGAKP